MKGKQILHLWFYFYLFFSFTLNGEDWDGPIEGPKAQTQKTIIFIASDFKNGGVTGVYRSFENAARILQWKIHIKNGSGKIEEQKKQIEDAISLKPDAIVFGGISSNLFQSEITKAKSAKIILAGWHASEIPGPTKDLFVNITTKPYDVAKLATDLLLNHAKANKKKVGVIIFNDNQFSIANTKTRYMKNMIESCQGYKGCKVLSIENIPLAESDKLIPTITNNLLNEYKEDWTYTLAINDLYFETINLPLIFGNRRDIVNISAGDGSNTAISRIGFGKSQQIATIAEPLNLQGYQLADELNRAFAAKPTSGYISKPILITTEFLKKISKREIDSLLGFEKAYTSIWNKSENSN